MLPAGADTEQVAHGIVSAQVEGGAGILQKPDLADETLVERLRGAYGLPVVQVTFLALGGDLRSAVYRVAAEGGEDTSAS